MAQIRSFHKIQAALREHATEVDCGYQVLRASGQTLLQLSTYGSDTRQSRPKVSQTIQLDEAAARELVEIVQDAFPGLR